MKWVVVDELLISCASAGAVDNEVWGAYVKELKENKRVAVHLACGIGAVEVSSLQRKAASDALKVRGVPVAVVTDSGVVRGIVTAVSWLGVNISAFDWGDVRSALRYLKVNKLTEEHAVVALAQLRESCLGKKPGGEIRPPGASHASR